MIAERMHPGDLRAYLAMEFYKLYIMSVTPPRTDPHNAAIREADDFMEALGVTVRPETDFEAQTDVCLMCDHVQRICEVEQRAAAESDRANKAEARVKELEDLCSNEWGENAAAYLRGISISARSHGWGPQDGTLNHWLEQQLDLALEACGERERCRRLICNHLDLHEIDHLEGPELDATVRLILEA